MLKNDKLKLVENVASDVQGKSIVFVDYEGMDMEGFDAMRSQVRPHGAVVKVVKNTLLRRVMEQGDNAKLLPDVPEDVFSGMTAVGFVDTGNFSVSGKVILKAEKKAQVKIKGGIHEGALLTAEEVRAIVGIPSKEELYASLVGVFSSIVGKLVVVLDEVKAAKG